MKNKKLFNYVKLNILNIVIFSIACLGILGWIMNKLNLAWGFGNFIPMAPSTAISFILFCISLFLINNFNKSKVINVIVNLFLLAISLFSGFILINYIFDITLVEGYKFIYDSVHSGIYPIGIMSPITSILFLTSCFIFYLIINKQKEKNRDIINKSSLLILIISFVLLIGYLYNEPLLYGSDIIPVALSTAICFFLLSLSFFQFNGIIEQLNNQTIKNSLLKSFIPLILGIIIIQGFLYVYIYSNNYNSALLSAIVLFLAIALSIFLIIKISSVFERKLLQSEFDLRESEERYKTFFDKNHSVILLINPETSKIENANQAAIQFYGWSHEELCNKYLYDINLLPKKEILNRIAHAIKSNQNHLFFTHKIANGEIREVEVFSGPIKFRNSVLLYSNIYDITEHKKAEKTIAMLAQAVRSVSEFLCITNIEKEIIFVNNAFLKAYQYEENELIGNTIELIFSSKNQTDIINIIRRETLKEGWSGEIKSVKKDGSEFYINLSTSKIIDDNGVVIGIIGVAKDITEIKNAERAIKIAYKKLVRAQKVAKIGSWEQNLLTNEIFWSDEMFDIFGIPLNTPINFNDANKFLSTEDIEKLKLAIAKTINENVPYKLDYKIVCLNGVEKYIHGEGEVTRDENGKAIWFYGTSQDITDRKQIENELIVSKQKAEESDNLKTAFLKNISHEIRTPFNGILGFISLLIEEDVSNEEKEKYFKIINNSSSRLMETINNIVEISNIQASEMTFKFSEFNANQLVDDILNQYLYEINSKGLTIKFENKLAVENSLIITDYIKLKTILNNLINNAMKFTTKGFIEIGVSNINKSLEFYIKDTGIGIPKNMNDEIYKIFTQVDVSDTREYEGNGLGLSIAKAYIEALNGEIWFESEENKGSVFHFTIPSNSKLNINK